MESSEDTFDESMGNLLFATGFQSLSVILMLAALLVALRASYLLYKWNRSPWSRVIFPCLIASLFIHIFSSIYYFWLDWDFFIYLEHILLTIDALLLLLIAISFSRLAEYVSTDGRHEPIQKT